MSEHSTELTHILLELVQKCGHASFSERVEAVTEARNAIEDLFARVVPTPQSQNEAHR